MSMSIKCLQKCNRNNNKNPLKVGVHWNLELNRMKYVYQKNHTFFDRKTFNSFSNIILERFQPNANQFILLEHFNGMEDSGKNI